MRTRQISELFLLDATTRGDFPFCCLAYSFIHRLVFSEISRPMSRGRQMGAFRSGGRPVRPARFPLTWPTQAPSISSPFCYHFRPGRALFDMGTPSVLCFLFVRGALTIPFPFFCVLLRAFRLAEPCDRNAVFPSLNNPRRDGYCQSIKDKFPQVSHFDSFRFLSLSSSLFSALSSFAVRSSSCAIRRLSFSRGRRLFSLGHGRRRFGEIRLLVPPTRFDCHARSLLVRWNFSR